jgi:REP element-mobilizing transposase RayT
VLKTPGKIILKNWNKISQRFKNVRTDDLVIMPNHIHGILMIYDNKRVTARVTPT